MTRGLQSWERHAPIKKKSHHSDGGCFSCVCKWHGWLLPDRAYACFHPFSVLKTVGILCWRKWFQFSVWVRYLYSCQGFGLRVLCCFVWLVWCFGVGFFFFREGICVFVYFLLVLIWFVVVCFGRLVRLVWFSNCLFSAMVQLAFYIIFFPLH